MSYILGNNLVTAFGVAPAALDEFFGLGHTDADGFLSTDDGEWGTPGVQISLLTANSFRGTYNIFESGGMSFQDWKAGDGVGLPVATDYRITANITATVVSGSPTASMQITTVTSSDGPIAITVDGVARDYVLNFRSRTTSGAPGFGYNNFSITGGWGGGSPDVIDIVVNSLTMVKV